MRNTRTLALVAIFLALLSGALYVRQPHVAAQVVLATSDTNLVTPTDSIPNFCKDSAVTITATLDHGAWSNAATWTDTSGIHRSVTAQDIVRIPSNITVNFDDPSGVATCVGIAGTLSFSRSVSSQLTATHILVFPTGYLDIGNITNPIPNGVTAVIEFADTPINTSSPTAYGFDPSQFGNGLIGLGKVTMHGAPLAEAFMRVSVEPLVGATTLSFANPVTGWRVGDKVKIPDTRQLQNNELGNNYVPQDEERSIVGISPSGTVLTLASPLNFNHKGARNANGVLEYLPHVMNMSRNVVLRSANPAGVRGHSLFTYRADVDIRYTAFQDMGRTKFTPLDNTTYVQGGTTNHIGTNQIGRYAIHMHHLYGPATPTNPNQFTLVGNAINQGVASHSFKWGIAIHDSHFGLIQKNVVYNTMGAGIVTEDGSETKNIFDNNFIMRVGGSGNRGDGRGTTDLAHGGQAFWFRGPNNYVRNNVAAQVVPNVGADGGYGYDFFQWYTGNVKFPNQPGDDTVTAGQFTTVNSHTQPLLEFTNNEVYGSESGLTYWWICAADTVPYPPCATTFTGLHAWHLFNNAVFHYPSLNITFDGLVDIGDATKSNNGGRNIGFYGADYGAPGLVINNSRIENVALGVYPSTAGANVVQTIKNSRIAADIGIKVGTLWTSSYNALGLSPRHVALDNVFFTHVAGKTAYKSMSMSYSPSPVSNPIVTDDVKVTSFNQIPGSDFQVFFAQQHPGFEMHKYVYNTDGTMFMGGCPEAGLTNTQCQNAYGISIAGGVATGTDTVPTIDGIVGPLPGSAPLNLPTQPPLIFMPSSHVSNQPGLAITPEPNNKFTFTFTAYTNKPATMSITSSSFTAVADTAPVAGKHVFVVSGLNPGQNVTYQLKAVDLQGLQTTNANQTVSTPVIAGDVVAPVISYDSWTVAGGKNSNATVTWSTNEMAISDVSYWLASNPSQVFSASSPLLEKWHSIALTGLTPGAQYVVRIKATDAAGNISVSQDIPLKTLGGTVTSSVASSSIPASSSSVAVSSVASSAASSVGASTSSVSSSAASSTSSLYNAAPVAPPVAYWPFNDTTGAIAHEQMHGVDGTLQNSPQWTIGKLGGALDFTGTTTHVTVPHANFPDLGNTFTVNFWTKPNGTGNQEILGFDNALVLGGIEVTAPSSNNNSVMLGTRSVIVAQTNSNVLIPGQWNHVVITKNGSAAGASKIYINGVLQTLTTNAAYTFHNPVTTKYFGVRTSALDRHLAGQLDDLCLFDRELSSAEVSSLYNNGNGTPCVVPNTPPVVNAGPDQTIALTALASLQGTATDDGLPIPPGTMQKTWSKMSGPGTVTFGSATTLNSTASFSTAGTYVLQLAVSDGVLTTTDTVTIVVTTPNSSSSSSASSSHSLSSASSSGPACLSSDAFKLIEVKFRTFYGGPAPEGYPYDFNHNAKIDEEDWLILQKMQCFYKKDTDTNVLSLPASNSANSVSTTIAPLFRGPQGGATTTSSRTSTEEVQSVNSPETREGREGRTEGKEETQERFEESGRYLESEKRETIEEPIPDSSGAMEPSWFSRFMSAFISSLTAWLYW